jgi:thiamine-phosphate pyrophosphorylase
MRIIDVNLNRATEGLRVVEEVCRFVLEDRALTVKIKELRGKLSRIVPQSLLAHRDSAGDVGREPYTRDEGRRAKVDDVFRANMKRAQEAVRCLEEFAKLLKPSYGRAFKRTRFKLYELEKQVALKVSKAGKLDFDLYIIVDAGPAALKTVRRALARGVRIVQLRDKDISRRGYLRAARKIARLTSQAGVTFLLNDHWGLVQQAGADGIHLGQDDLKGLSVRKLRRVLGGEAIIGLSASNLKEARQAERAGADYIGFGPVFPTPFKSGVKATGTKLLRQVIDKVRIPVVAIGGIRKANIDKIKKAGCQRFAAIRGWAGLSGSRG